MLQSVNQALVGGRCLVYQRPNNKKSVRNRSARIHFIHHIAETLAFKKLSTTAAQHFRNSSSQRGNRRGS